MTITNITTAPQVERIDYTKTLSSRTKTIILLGVFLGMFLAALDQTIVATALPAIVAEFRGIDLLAWVSTGYLLASTALTPIYGKLSDLCGRRNIVLFGIVVFLLGSSLCGLSGNMLQLIFFRIIQGIGSAALLTTAFAIPADLFPPNERARSQGLLGAVFGLSSVIGPFLGGVLTQYLSWRWVFYVNIPIGIIALLVIVFRMPRFGNGVRASIDWLGTILLIVAVAPLLLGLTLDKTLYPWTSPLILGLLATAVIATILFLLVEARATAPIIPLNLFGNRTFAILNMLAPLNSASFFVAILFLPIFMVNVVGVSATSAGLVLIPQTLAIVASSIGASFLLQRIGRYKAIVLTGLALVVIGLVLFAFIGSTPTVWDVVWRIIVLGLGVGMTLPLFNIIIQNAVPYEQVGTATASTQFFQQIGQSLGAAIFGVILATILTAQITANVEPAIARLPVQAQHSIDINQLKNGNTGTQSGSDSSATVLKNSGEAGKQVQDAVRLSFANSITSIYFYLIFLAVVAFLLGLIMPELPLRKSNQDEIPDVSV